LLEVKLLRSSLPAVVFVPDQSPEATQVVAFVDVQVSVDEPFQATEVGFAVRVTVGTGIGSAPTETVAVATADPPRPVHVIVYVVLEVRLDFSSVPERDLLPDHPPVAVQDVAFVDVQARVDDPFQATDVGFAVRVTVGAGIGSAPTETVAFAEAVPPGPVQVIV
jgi:hypothetical protein